MLKEHLCRTILFDYVFNEEDLITFLNDQGLVEEFVEWLGEKNIVKENTVPKAIGKHLHIFTRERNANGNVVENRQAHYGRKTVAEALKLIRKEMVVGNDVQATWEYRHG